METWLPITIEGFPTLSVSSDGRVRLPSGKLTFGTDTWAGYKQITLTKDGRSKCLLVHRLVAMAFINNEECLPHINHLDGNKQNNRPGNLEWCDQRRNVQHAHANGLTSNFGDGHWTRKNPEKVRRGASCNLYKNDFKGERHSQAKLSEDQIHKIREARARGEKLKAIASTFGVSESTICAICKGRRWSHS